MMTRTANLLCFHCDTVTPCIETVNEHWTCQECGGDLCRCMGCFHPLDEVPDAWRNPSMWENLVKSTDRQHAYVHKEDT